MQTYGADPRGVRVQWRHGGSWTRLVGVTELGQLMGTGPNLALSVLEDLGRWEGGRSAGGMDPQRKGWVRLHDRAGETSSSSSSSTSSSTSSGGRTPPPPSPPNPPQVPQEKNPLREERGRRPPPQAQQSKPKAKAKPKGKGKGKATPPKSQAPPLQDRGWDPYGNVPGVGDTRHVPWEEGGSGGTVSQVTVFGDWDEELDLGEWWVVSQGSNGEGGKKGKKGKKRKREQDGGTFRVAEELLFRTREEAEACLREALGEGDDGGDRDDGDDEGDEGDKGEKVGVPGKGGEVGGDAGVRRNGTQGVTMVEQGCSPGNPPPRRRGNLRFATREWGPGGAGG